jgi:formate dehydrogenase accessory protein FdhD
MWINQVKVITYTGEYHKKRSDSLIIDRHKTLIINEDTQIDLEFTPTKERELIIGYLICNKHAHTFDEINTIKVEEDSIHASTSKRTESPKEKNASTEKISAANIFRLTAYLQENALLFKDTAISESAALATDTELKYFSEDLNRHNAIYKSLGSAFQEKENLENLYLLTSAKVTKHTIKIAKQAGINCIISRTAPTSAAVVEAETSNLCLIGFARGRKLSVYTDTLRVSA